MRDSRDNYFRVVGFRHDGMIPNPYWICVRPLEWEDKDLRTVHSFQSILNFMRSTSPCAECGEPVYFDYLCATCRRTALG